jgi:hypothetical protein
MQPVARQPGTRPGFLARPKHGTARLVSCPCQPGPVDQAVLGLPDTPAGRHGPARQEKQARSRPGSGTRRTARRSVEPGCPRLGLEQCAVVRQRGVDEDPQLDVRRVRLQRRPQLRRLPALLLHPVRVASREEEDRGTRPASDGVEHGLAAGHGRSLGTKGRSRCRAEQGGRRVVGAGALSTARAVPRKMMESAWER